MSDASPGPRGADAAPDDESIAVARRYAEALIGAAQSEGAVDPLLDEFAEIEDDVFLRFPRFAAHLASTRVATAEKDRILREVFEGRASSLAVRFLRVLNRHQRLDLLAAVLREARAIWDRQNRRIPVQVRSAIPLDERQLHALRDQLASFLPGTPVLSAATEPELIGGLIVQVGDQLYDASVKNRLAQLRHRLIEGKIHEIQSRRDQFSYSA
jgi:F-type H+-transporting ATPase subunit delta